MHHKHVEVDMPEESFDTSLCKNSISDLQITNVKKSHEFTQIITFHCYIPRKTSYYLVNVDTENEDVNTSSSHVQNTPTVSGM